MNEFDYELFMDGIENAHDYAEYGDTSESSDDDDDCDSNRW